MVAQSSVNSGVIPAVVTPLDSSGRFHAANFERHIDSLAGEGCHGIVVLGTTGEGPSLGLEERKKIITTAVKVSGDMQMIAGTGCASLADTVILTRYAFAQGVDAVLVIPPYFFKNVPHDGLVAYFQHLLESSVPDGGKLLLYHIPQVTQVPITPELLDSLLAIAPKKVAGVKDSSGNLEHLEMLCNRFPRLQIYAGNDRHLLAGLEAGSAGCITAGANVLAPLNMAVYQAFHTYNPDAEGLQEHLTAGRSVLDQYMPFAPSIKYLLSRRYGSAGWEPRPPLLPLPDADQASLVESFRGAGISEWLDWVEHLST
jgi:4-hydroxy-tetrahydrodipicolinate synthase